MERTLILLNLTVVLLIAGAVAPVVALFAPWTWPPIRWLATSEQVQVANVHDSTSGLGAWIEGS